MVLAVARFTEAGVKGGRWRGGISDCGIGEGGFDLGIPEAQGRDLSSSANLLGMDQTLAADGQGSFLGIAIVEEIGRRAACQSHQLTLAKAKCAFSR